MWQQRTVRFAPVALDSGVTRRLIMLTAGVFFAEALLWPGAGTHPFMRTFGLSRNGLFSGMIWQLLTYSFLHGSLLHLIGNMLGLYFFGRELEERFGARRFLLLYLGCGVLGGLGWLVLSTNAQAVCIGASGSVFGIIGAYAALYPHRRVTLLLFFVLPVTLSARMLALIFGLISIVMLRADGGGVAHAAHLAGGIAGYLYGMHFSGGHMPWHSGWQSFSNRRAQSRRNRFRLVSPQDAHPVDWQEVDRILDKVRIQGIGGLTPDERGTLDRASRQA